MSHILP